MLLRVQVVVLLILIFSLLGCNGADKENEADLVSEDGKNKTSLQEEGTRDVRIWEDGVYEGDLSEDLREGSGKFTFDNGDIYDGEFEAGGAHGKGTLTRANGDNYEGEWKNGLRHGKGTYTWENGSTYEGPWENDKENGEGVFTFPDGHRYVGEWQDGEAHGYGTLYDSNGDISFEGQWLHSDPVYE